MSDATALPIEQRPRRFYFDWLFPLLLRPRATLAKIVALGRPSWLTPLLVLTITNLLVVAVAGPIKITAAQNGEVNLPDVFQYWSAEDQAQYLQTQQLTATGPVFIYVFPAILGLLGLWLGWLVLGGLLHLMLTLLGGRDNTGGTLNVVAWAALPFALRDLVRIGYMLVQHQLLASPGLTGFAPTGTGWLYAALGDLFGRIDIYTLWYLVLLYLGVRVAVGLSRGKALAGLVIALLIVTALALAPTIALSLFSGLSVIQPFF